MKITILTIDTVCDPVKAIYIDDILYKYGDEYHNKISDFIKGFVDGLNISKIQYTINSIDCDDDKWINECCEIGNPPPTNLSDLK